MLLHATRDNDLFILIILFNKKKPINKQKLKKKLQIKLPIKRPN